VLDQKTLIKAGIAAFLPGMRLALDTMEGQFREYRAMLDQLENGDLEVFMPPRRGRPSKALIEARAMEESSTVGMKAKQSDGVKGYWAQMTPQERSAEMRRRFQVAATAKLANGATKKQRRLWCSTLTPEQVSAEMQRRRRQGMRKAVSAANQVVAQKPLPPERVGSNYTVAGIGRQFGLTPTGVKTLLVRKKIPFRNVPHPSPSGHGRRVSVITAAQFERVKKFYEKSRPLGADGRRLHPRDKAHPEHAALMARANATRARTSARGNL
jgi:hypothetical protein